MHSEFQGLKILVVDDEELLREILVETFAMCGAVVDSADGGNNAFEKIKTNRYDVVISDVRMPDGDGIALMERINALMSAGVAGGGSFVRPKLFVCSAYNDLTAEKIKQLHILEIFNKPFDIEHLLTRIGAYIEPPKLNL